MPLHTLLGKRKKGHHAVSWRLRDIGQCIIIELCMDQHPVLRMPFLSPSLSGSFTGGSWGNWPALTRTKYLFPDICPSNWDHVVLKEFSGLFFLFCFVELLTTVQKFLSKLLFWVSLGTIILRRVLPGSEKKIFNNNTLCIFITSLKMKDEHMIKLSLLLWRRCYHTEY